jgi:hypothetical protein
MNKKVTVVALLTLFCTACSSIQTSQDYDPATNFTSLQTVAWKSPTQPETGDERIDNPFRDTRIRDAIQRQLEAKGLVFKPDQATDGRVRYQYTLRQRIDSSGPSSSVGFGIGSYGRRGGIAIGTGTGNDLRQIDEGTLVIDLLSADTDTLLWRGSGTQRFQEYDDPARATKDINALVEAIMKQFPPAN